VEEADPPMTEIVRRPQRDAGGAARLRDARPDRVRTARSEQTSLRITILAGRKCSLNRLGEDVWQLDPKSASGLGSGGAQTDATARFVVVADPDRVDARDAGT